MARLLIVDDDHDLLQTLTDAFVMFGFEVTPTGNGRQALEFFKQSPFDLAILDVELPDLNGFEITKEIKKQKPDFPIILITAYSHLYRPQDVLRLNIEAFLKKPLNIQELVNIVRKIVEKYSDESPHQPDQIP